VIDAYSFGQRGVGGLTAARASEPVHPRRTAMKVNVDVC